MFVNILTSVMVLTCVSAYALKINSKLELNAPKKHSKLELNAPKNNNKLELNAQKNNSKLELNELKTEVRALKKDRLAVLSKLATFIGVGMPLRDPDARYSSRILNYFNVTLDGCLTECIYSYGAVYDTSDKNCVCILSANFIHRHDSNQTWLYYRFNTSLTVEWPTAN